MCRFYGAARWVSVTGPRVLQVQSDDVIDPGDAALHEFLALVAEQTNDPARRDQVIDFLMTMPPLAQWSAQERDILTETCGYVISLARLRRELDELDDPSDRDR